MTILRVPRCRPDVAHLSQAAADRLEGRWWWSRRKPQLSAPLQLPAQPLLAPVRIVLVCWNGLAYTRRCLESLERHTQGIGQNVEILVVDNGSQDGTLEYLKSLPWVQVLANAENRGYSRANNQGLQNLPGDGLLLNNDVEILQDGWLEELQRVAYQSDQIGIVGCRMLLGDGRLLHAGTCMHMDTWRGHQIGSLDLEVRQYGLDREVEGVVGACFYLKRSTLDLLGGLDESYFAYYEDSAYCFKAAEAGLKTVCAGRVTIIHHHNISTKVNGVSHSTIYDKAGDTFRRQWTEKLQARYTKCVVWRSEFSRSTGYAVSSKELVLALDRQHVHPHLASLFPEQEKLPTDADLGPIVRRSGRSEGPEVTYAAGEYLDRAQGKYRIGYTMFEVDGVPAGWIDKANRLDELWVPSNFNLDTFRSSGLKIPIQRMPLGVNPDYFHPGVASRRFTSRYTFCAVLDWGERKGVDLLLQAYARAFTARDDVLLFLKVLTIDRGARPQDTLARYKTAAPVLWSLNQDIPSSQMGCLYRSCDCLVAPSRGEGWGMTSLEAMACGLPVIATDWGASREFLTPDNAYLLNITGLVPARSRCPYYHGFRWAQPDIEHLVHLLRHTYENRDQARARGEQAARDAHSQWTWTHAAQRIRARIDEL